MKRDGKTSRPADPDRRLNRRDFARCAICALGVPGVGVALAKAAASQQPDALAIDLSDPTFDALKEVGGALKIAREGEAYPVLVVRIDAQTIIAYSSACTHWDCEVELPDEEGRVECHCHGSEFDLQGRYVDGPAFGDLVRVPVQVIWPTAVSPNTWGEVKGTALDPSVSSPEDGS